MRTFTTVMTMVLTMGAFAATPHGINVANIDTSVSPGTDFYNYACGGWIKANPLKAEYSRFGTFDQLENSTENKYTTLSQALTPRRQQKAPTNRRLQIFLQWAWIVSALTARGHRLLRTTFAVSIKPNVPI